MSENLKTQEDIEREERIRMKVREKIEKENSPDIWTFLGLLFAITFFILLLTLIF